MKFEYLPQKFAIIFLSLSVFASLAPAQKPGSPVPRQEKLLNGLKVLIWNTPAADKVTVQIRVHGGSAFDPQGREGVMKLLSESIFPNQAAREFFTEDLGGNLEIVSNYDYIQINASSQTDEFLTMLETIAAAVSNPSIDKETTTALKSALTVKITDLEKDPAYIADMAAAKRLFGTFPYGRPQIGTLESVQKIDFADLRFAKDRLFTADNATIAISGNIEGNLAFRAIRRYFGSWLKSDKKIPSTFAIPSEPDTKWLEINVPGTGNSEVRFAFRGLARNDIDFAASQILTAILQERLQKQYGIAGKRVFVSHIPHILPGAFVLGYQSEVKPISTLPESHLAPSHIQSMFTRISDEEFAKAKNIIQASIKGKKHSDWWLDLDTFKTNAVSNEMQAISNATVADVRRVAERLSKNPVAVVSVTQTEIPSQTSRN
ncbi:MAG: insulinase family protein [Blastocatellia bacterium]|nr:insulinase family protein [Blastocatellia bacterium]